MTKIVCTALVASSLLILGAVCAKAETYSAALTKCSAEWKASDQRAKVVKGTGQAAWNNFRSECVVRHGYVKQKRSQATKRKTQPE